MLFEAFFHSNFDKSFGQCLVLVSIQWDSNDNTNILPILSQNGKKIFEVGSFITTIFLLFEGSVEWTDCECISVRTLNDA